MITWSGLLIDRYCSSWSIVQMLGWLNHSRVTWLQTKRAWRFYTRRHAVLLPAGEAGMPLPEQQELSEVARLLSEPRRWLPEAGLRFCPQCLGFGMHYAYQQDYRFINCIVHGCALEEQCPGCGSPLDTRGVNCNGFVCFRCSGSLLAANFPVLRDEREISSVVTALGELEDWQAVAARLSIGYQEPSTGRAFPIWGVPSLNDKNGWYWRVLDLNPSPRVAAAIETAPISFHFIPNTSATISLESAAKQSADKALQPYKDLFVAVARHIRRSYLRGHRACWMCATAAMGRLGNGMNKQTYILPSMCCLGQAYALWCRQWDHEFGRTELWIERALNASTASDYRLPSLHAAQLGLISSFQHWTESLAVIQEAYRGSNHRAILDGVTGPPHWALLQKGAARSCPIHFRHPDLRTLGQCDRGRVWEQELAKVMAKLREIRRPSRPARASDHMTISRRPSE